MRIVDDYEDGEGKLEGRLLGVRFLRQASPEAATAQALRYLAELPWVPHAMAHNGELEWRELDERSVEVAAHVRRRSSRVVGLARPRGSRRARCDRS